LLDEGRREALKGALAKLAKKHGRGAAYAMDGSRVMPPVDVIPTGSLALDRALGVGGFAKGRIVELYGEEGSGKTTLALSCVAQCQKAGGVAVFIDVEHALDIDYSKQLGVHIDTKDNPLIVSQPDSAEEVFEIVETFIQSSGVDLIVVDSVAGLVPIAEVEGEFGDHHVGLKARLMGQALRKIVPFANEQKVCVIFINQIREKIGVFWGDPTTTPGGRALKFHASQRVQVCPRKRIKRKNKAGKEVPIGYEVIFKVVKNKLAPPFRQAESSIRFGRGIERLKEVANLSSDLGIIERRGGYYYLEGDQIAAGKKGLYKLLREDKKLRAKIEKLVLMAGKDEKVVDDEEDD